MNTTRTTNKYKVSDEIKELAAVLQELRPGISAEDRREARRRLNIGRTKLSECLNGKVKDLEKAHKLIKFFSDRIEKRRKSIA